jgi:putative FmdB family regulatory protein
MTPRRTSLPAIADILTCGLFDWVHPQCQDATHQMPLFDFRCRRCGAEFEALVRTGHATVCSCGSDDLEQLPSGFAVSSSSIRKANLDAVRRKGAQARKEKLRADHGYMQKHIRDEH